MAHGLLYQERQREFCSNRSLQHQSVGVGVEVGFGVGLGVAVGVAVGVGVGVGAGLGVHCVVALAVFDQADPPTALIARTR